MSIRIRVFSAFLGFCALTCLIAGIALFTNHQINEAIPQVVESSLPEFNLASELEMALLTLQLSLEKGISSEASPDLSQPDPGHRRREEAVQIKLDEIRLATERSIQLAEHDDEVDEVGREKEELQKLEAFARELISLRANLDTHRQLLATHQEPAATRLKREVIDPQLEDRMLPFVRDFRRDSHQEVVTEAGEMAKSVRRGSLLVQVGTILTVLLGLLVSWLTARSIVRPIYSLEHAARSLQEGNLTSRVCYQSKDELGMLARVFNAMTTRLQANAEAEKQHREALQAREAELHELNEVLEDRVKQRTAELSASEERYTHMLNATCDGLWDWNISTGVVYYSPQWIRLLGFPPEQVSSTVQFFKDLIHPEDLQHTLQVLEDHLAGRTPVKELELRLRLSSGDYRWFLDRGKVVVRAPDGTPLRMVGTITDIAARKQVESDLAQTNARLLEASRKAGMAEVATGVLHNVGNVLNSVNVSANLMMAGLQKSKTSSLANAVTLMRENQHRLGEFLTNDSKGRRLPEFLNVLAGHLASEQSALVDEMKRLQGNVDHIKQIVSRQQSYAKTSGILEQVSLADVLEDAVRMSASSIARHEITILREFQPVPPALVDRHLTLQILINLVTNAKQALLQRPDERTLTLRIKQSERQRIRIEVTDNGVGIPPENLACIFTHGFTTKQAGHGFGLHSSANAAKEMGGTLTAFSGGIGTGATFALELPQADNTLLRQAA